MRVDGRAAVTPTTTPARVTLMLWALTLGAFLTTSSGATRSPKTRRQSSEANRRELTVGG
jgi:hypothetical protein